MNERDNKSKAPMRVRLDKDASQLVYVIALER